MKLINDFFEVIALTPSEGELRCKVKFNPEHFIYKAHFPGNPVTPGVCLVQMAAEILGEQYHWWYAENIGRLHGRAVAAG